jgi:hypothetical protein
MFGLLYYPASHSNLYHASTVCNGVPLPAGVKVQY